MKENERHWLSGLAVLNSDHCFSIIHNLRNDDILLNTEENDTQESIFEIFHSKFGGFHKIFEGKLSERMKIRNVFDSIFILPGTEIDEYVLKQIVQSQRKTIILFTSENNHEAVSEFKNIAFKHLVYFCQQASWTFVGESDLR